jgi:Tfp pilus assembly protein PilO
MMRSPRTWHLIAVLAVLVIVALGWFLGASPLLQQAAAADQSRAQVQQQNAQQRTVLASMRGQYDKLDELQAQMASLQLSVPGTADLDDFFDQVAAIASASGASITSITAGEAQPYGLTAGGSGTPAKSAASSTPQPTSSATPAASATPAPAATAAAPVAAAPKTPTGDLASKLYVVPIDISLSSGPSQVTAFVNGLQTGKRLILVSSMAYTSSPAGGTVSGFVFVVHDPSASAASPSPTSSPTSTGVATPAPTPSSTNRTPGPAPTPTK